MSENRTSGVDSEVGAQTRRPSRQRRPLDVGAYANSAGSNVRDALAAGPGTPAADMVEVPVELIDAGRFQSRVVFDEPQDDSDDEASLDASIEDSGLNNPVTLRPKDGGRYELIAGERRLRSVRRLGKPTILSRVRALTDFEARLVASAENRSRRDLSPWEEARDTAAIRDDMAAAGLGDSRRKVARFANVAHSKVSEQLAIAEALTPELIDAAGVPVRAVCELAHVALHRIAKLDPDERVEALRAAVGQQRQPMPQSTATEAAPDVDRFTKIWERGGFQLNIRPPIREMKPGRAGAYLEQMMPGIAALTARRADADGFTAAAVSGDYGTLLYIPADGDVAAGERARIEAVIRDLTARLGL